MKLIFVISSLEYSGMARQLTLLATHLPGASYAVRVCVLGPESPWCRDLQKAGVDVINLGWRYPFDPRPWYRLRGLLRDFAPDLVHAWGLPAFRAVATLARPGNRIFLSGLAREQSPCHLSPVDRWLIHSRAFRIITQGVFETEHCRQIGLPAERLLPIPPAVFLPVLGKQSRTTWAKSLGLPENQRYLVGLGPLDPAKGFREAVWAFDILRLVVEDLHLLLIGTGTDEARLRRFSRITGTADRVHFLKRQRETHLTVEQAAVVWVPSMRNRGVNSALEAMAAGRPVVASRWPSLAEVILDGRTGVLVPPGEPGALARETRLLLDAPERCRELGNAGRQRVAAQFSLKELVRRHRAVYGQNGL